MEYARPGEHTRCVRAGERLVRFSAGCEDAADIIADLGQALDAAGIA